MEPFALATYAYKKGLGAFLMQNSDGKMLTIPYASRTLSKAVTNYSVTEFEALAVAWALTHHRDLIFGYPVHVLTEHAPVVELLSHRTIQEN